MAILSRRPIETSASSRTESGTTAASRAYTRVGCDAAVVDPDVVTSEAVAYLDRLAQILLNRSAWVYARLNDAAHYQVNLQEETLTEDLLLDIAKQLPQKPDLTLSQFNRGQEADNGADWQWEWWFHGRRWFGVRVQAKKLRPLRQGREPGYDLTYRIGKDRERRQLDVLLQHAREDNIAPAYVFYNGPELKQFDFTWGCRGLAESCENFGVSYLHAAAVDLLLRNGRAAAETVMSASRPWPCLIRCGPEQSCHPRVPPPPFSPSFDEAVAWSLFRTVVESPVSNQSQDNPFGWLRERVDRYCHDSPPEYVQRLADGQADLTPQLRPSVRAVTLLSHQP